MTNLRVFRLTRLILAAAVSAAMTGCSGDKDSLGDLASSVQPPSNPPAIEQAQPAAEARYSYPHGSKRDPFVPLIGGARSVASQSGDGSSFTTQRREPSAQGDPQGQERQDRPHLHVGRRTLHAQIRPGLRQKEPQGRRDHRRHQGEQRHFGHPGPRHHGTGRHAAGGWSVRAMNPCWNRTRRNSWDEFPA